MLGGGDDVDLVAVRHDPLGAGQRDEGRGRVVGDFRRRIAGVAPRWFRAVVGMANPFVSAPLRDARLARAGWSARGFDAVDGDVVRVLGKLERGLSPGAIVLLHEGAAHGRSVEMVAKLLQRLDALGYRTAMPDA